MSFQAIFSIISGVFFFDVAILLIATAAGNPFLHMAVAIGNLILIAFCHVMGIGYLLFNEMRKR